MVLKILISNLLEKSPIKIGRIVFYVLVFTIIFLSISVASILVLLSNASAVACAFWRTFLSAIILWFIKLLLNRSWVGLRNYKVLSLIVLSGVFLAAHFLFWMESLFLVPVAISTTIVVSYPLFSLVVDKIIYNERIYGIQYIGLTTGFIGIAFFMEPRLIGEYSVSGVILALLGAVAATGYFSIGRRVRKVVGLLEYTTIAYSSAAITLLVYSLFTGANLVHYGLNSYIYFFLLAIIPMLGGHTLLNYVLKYIKTSSATSIALGEPVGASILAYIFLGQIITPIQILLIIVILLSIALVLYPEIRNITEKK
ncbi:DMT family transporter [Staphylothermus hellenicus]|nr:DMT family transporter [Staphylothermus hellenicus]